MPMASFAYPLQNLFTRNSVDLRIAETLVGGFALFVCVLPARWRFFGSLPGLAEFSDHPPAQRNHEPLALADPAEKFGQTGSRFRGGDLDWGLGWHWGCVLVLRLDPGGLIVNG